LGGAVVVMRRVETGESYSGEISLGLFQGKVFKTKAYLVQALKVVMEGMERLKVSQDEPIHICTGYILSKAREALVEEGYNVEGVKIVGPTQEMAEREFLKSLVRLGIGDMAALASMRSFNSFLSWVHKDLEERERYVKTGWNSWPRLRIRRASRDTDKGKV
jgi:hypothetical protein